MRLVEKALAVMDFCVMQHVQEPHQTVCVNEIGSILLEPDCTEQCNQHVRW